MTATQTRRRGRPPKSAEAMEAKVWTTHEVADLIHDEMNIYARKLRAIAAQLNGLADDMTPQPIEDLKDTLRDYRKGMGYDA